MNIEIECSANGHNIEEVLKKIKEMNDEGIIPEGTNIRIVDTYFENEKYSFTSQ